MPELVFTFARPRGHYGRRGLRPSAPRGHAIRPDLDKLVRAVLDALVGAGVIRNDAQVAELHATKGYGERPGLAVVLRSLEANEAKGPGALLVAPGAAGAV